MYQHCLSTASRRDSRSVQSYCNIYHTLLVMAMSSVIAQLLVLCSCEWSVLLSDACACCLCGSCVGPLCGPPLRWWVLCGALPSVWVPCVGPLCGSPVWVPCVGPLRNGSTVWVPCVGPSSRCVSCGIYSRDVSRSFTRSRSRVTC